MKTCIKYIILFSLIILTLYNCKKSEHSSFETSEIIVKLTPEIKTIYEHIALERTDISRDEMYYSKSAVFNSISAYYLELKYFNSEDIENFYKPSENDKINHLEMDQEIIFHPRNDHYNYYKDEYDEDTVKTFGFNLIMNNNQAFTEFPDNPINPILIGIISTGVDYNHEDLKDKIWVNKNEIPDNQIDDDNNGYIDDVYGCNFMTDQKYVPLGEKLVCGDPIDVSGYGTSVAGVIARPTSPEKQALAESAKIVILKAFEVDDNNKIRAQLSNIIAALNYAVQLKIKIIYLDLPVKQTSYALKEIIDLTNDQLIIIPVGDNSINVDDLTTDNTKNPLILTDANNAIFVEATSNKIGKRADFSNWESATDRIDIAAPGKGIYTTALNNKYHYQSSTRMSAAYVTGSLGWLHSQCVRWDMPYLKNQMLASVLSGTLNTYFTRSQKILQVPTAIHIDNNGPKHIRTADWRTNGHNLWCPIYCPRWSCGIEDDTNKFTTNMAMKSGPIADNEKSTLTAEVYAEDGDIKSQFEWKVSSEASKDYLYFYVDGTEQAKISGIKTHWIVQNYDLITKGPHTLTWSYVKDASGKDGEDAGWVKYPYIKQINIACEPPTPFFIKIVWSSVINDGNNDLNLHVFEADFGGSYTTTDNDLHHIYSEHTGEEKEGNYGAYNTGYDKEEGLNEEIYCKFKEPFGEGTYHIGVSNHSESTAIPFNLLLIPNPAYPFTFNYNNQTYTTSNIIIPYEITAQSKDDLMKLIKIEVTNSNGIVTEWQ